jgi:hypothetical protein
MSTLPDFFGNLYNGIAAALGQPIARPIGSPAEHVTHYLSLSVFVLLFGVLCWRAIRVPSRINNIPGLIRWLAFVWLLYCVVGSPWFWPWYIVTFLGLFAIIEATHHREEWLYGFLRFPLTVRILAFCLLSLYCFFSWAPLNSIVPGLPGFYWTDFRGLYAWMLPILGAM